MLSRKSNLASPGDVPSVIVGALIAWLLAIFVPLASLTPDLPSTLPPLWFPASAIVDFGHRPRPRPAPPFLDESYETLARAAASREPQALARAQRAFAALVIDAAGDDVSLREAFREHYLRRFLAALEHHPDHPLVTIAARHRFLETETPTSISSVSRAMLIAWFDLRWETLAARESLRDERLSLERLVGRIPPAERRAAVAWILHADCDALLGTVPDRALSPSQWQQCAAVRQEFVGLARRLDPSYPVDEARAAVDVLLARGLLQAATTARDPSERAALEQSAREAFGRAHGLYTLLAERDPSRRLRRYLLGTARAMEE